MTEKLRRTVLPPRLLAVGLTLPLIVCLTLSAMLPATAKKMQDPLLFEPAELQTGAQSNQLQAATQATNLQSSTQSTTLQTGTQSTTLQTGTQSQTLQVGTQNTTLQAGTAGALIQTGVQQQGGPVNVLIMLDCSYSMKEKLSGTPKLELAKRVLEETMSRVPNDINVGLRVFGQSYGGSDCTSTALLVPLGRGNRGSIISRARELRATGMTPLEFALRMAAEDDFRDVEGKKTIVLITDGADTCGGNPCAFIAMLPQYGIHIKCDVVGVDLKKGERNQLECIANTSGGKYYDANTAAKMIDGISASVNQAITGRVLNSNLKNGETPVELQKIEPLRAVPGGSL